MDWETAGSARSDGSCGFVWGLGWARSVRTCCWKTALAGCGEETQRDNLL